MAILAGVSVSMLTADNSIIKNAAEAKTSYENASAIEQIKLAMMGAIDLTGQYNIEKAKTEIQNTLKGSDVETKGHALVVTYKNKQYLAVDDYVKEWNGEAIQPKLSTGMVPVNYNETSKKWEKCTEQNWDWNYEAQTTTTENGGTSKWANAQTEDGSLWVWVRQLGG